MLQKDSESVFIQFGLHNPNYFSPEKGCSDSIIQKNKERCLLF